MEFSGQYLTYTEYRNLGGTLEHAPFNLLEFEARNQIDIATHNRLVNEKNIPQKVKVCMFHLIEDITKYANSLEKIRENGNIASESIDGYSMSFTKSSEIKDIINSKNADLQQTIITDLYGVIINNEHIIYSGV